MVFMHPVTQRCLRRWNHKGEHRPWSEVYPSGQTPPVYTPCNVFLTWEEGKWRTDKLQP